MLNGRFAKIAEFTSIVLMLVGVFALCQPWSIKIYSQGLCFLFWGWVGVNVFSHRKSVG
jgi:hypothetical protein